MKQIKCLAIKQREHDRDDSRQDERERVGQHKRQHFVGLEACSVFGEFVGQDNLRQIGHIGDKRNPRLNHDGLVGTKLETVKQISDGNRASADDFQVKITGAGSEQPHQHGYQKHDGIVNDSADHRAYVHDQTHGDRDDAHEAGDNGICADNCTIMSE